MDVTFTGPNRWKLRGCLLQHRPRYGISNRALQHDEGTSP